MVVVLWPTRSEVVSSMGLSMSGVLMPVDVGRSVMEVAAIVVVVGLFLVVGVGFGLVLAVESVLEVVVVVVRVAGLLVVSIVVVALVLSAMVVLEAVVLNTVFVVSASVVALLVALAVVLDVILVVVLVVSFFVASALVVVVVVEVVVVNKPSLVHLQLPAHVLSCFTTHPLKLPSLPAQASSVLWRVQYATGIPLRLEDEPPRKH